MGDRFSHWHNQRGIHESLLLQLHTIGPIGPDVKSGEGNARRRLQLARGIGG